MAARWRRCRCIRGWRTCWCMPGLGAAPLAALLADRDPLGRGAGADLALRVAAVNPAWFEADHPQRDHRRVVGIRARGAPAGAAGRRDARGADAGRDGSARLS